MLEQITLKIGQEVIIMNHRDIIDTIRDTLGDPLADLVAAELIHATNIYEDELQSYEAATIRDINYELEYLNALLEAPRLNRGKLKTSYRSIQKIVDNAY
jgi:hypothetical protein|nr:MAG TPA: hypothetical protein [Bacteriophage sp.]